jgi:hypothetical protein
MKKAEGRIKRSGASAERRILPAATLAEGDHRLSADSRYALCLLAAFQIS